MSIEDIAVPASSAALGAIASLIVASLIRNREKKDKALEARNEERRLMNQRIIDLDSQLKVLRESVAPISMAFQQILVKELTHFHEKRTDELLEKIGPPYTLTDAEEKELLEALEKRIGEAGSLMPDSEIDAAKMLPMLIKRVKAEAAMGIPPSPEQDLKLVTVPVESKDAK